MQSTDSISSFVYTVPWSLLGAYTETIRRAMPGDTWMRLTCNVVSDDMRVDDYRTYHRFRKIVIDAYTVPNSVSIRIDACFSHAFLVAFMPAYVRNLTLVPVATPQEIDVATRLVEAFCKAYKTPNVSDHWDPVSLDPEEEEEQRHEVHVSPDVVLCLLHGRVPLRSAYIDPVTSAFVVQCMRGVCFAVVRGTAIFPHGPALDLETGVSEDEVWRDHFPTMNQDVLTWNALRIRDVKTVDQILLWHGQ